MNHPIDTEKKGITVIGGANIDIKGKPKNVIQWETSNPGVIRISHGGVGRNIAHYLGLLNIPVIFLSAVGDDDEGREILEKLRNVQVETQEVIQSKKDPTGKYIAILNEKGEMQIAVSDTQIMKRITPRYLIAKAGIIKKNRLVVIDTNLTTQAIHAVAQLCHREKISLIVDPVSMVKSRKLLGILNRIDYLTPNNNELSALTGIVIKNSFDQKKAVNQLMTKGVKNVILTNRSKGVSVFTSANPDGEILKVKKRKIVDSTGAGDALVSGMSYGLYYHYDLFKSVEIGLILSGLAVTSPESVYSSVNESMIKKTITRMFKI